MQKFGGRTRLGEHILSAKNMSSMANNSREDVSKDQELKEEMSQDQSIRRHPMIQLEEHHPAKQLEDNTLERLRKAEEERDSLRTVIKVIREEFIQPQISKIDQNKFKEVKAKGKTTRKTKRKLMSSSSQISPVATSNQYGQLDDEVIGVDKCEQQKDKPDEQQHQQNYEKQSKDKHTVIVIH